MFKNRYLPITFPEFLPNLFRIFASYDDHDNDDDDDDSDDNDIDNNNNDNNNAYYCKASTPPDCYTLALCLCIYIYACIYIYEIMTLFL